MDSPSTDEAFTLGGLNASIHLVLSVLHNSKKKKNLNFNNQITIHQRNPFYLTEAAYFAKFRKQKAEHPQSYTYSIDDIAFKNEPNR